MSIAYSMSASYSIVDHELSAFQSQGITAIRQMIVHLLQSLVRPIATVHEVVVRQNLGERYFTFYNFIAGSVLILLGALPWEGISRDLPTTFSGLRHCWTFADWVNTTFGCCWFLLFLSCSITHFSRVRERYAKKILWHSYSYGESSTDAKFRPFTQSVFVILAGLGLMWFKNYGEGAVFLLSGFFSAQARGFEAARFHNRMLDLIDHRLEQENLSEAVTERMNAAKTAGFVTPVRAYVSQTHRQKFLEAMQPAIHRGQPRPQIAVNPFLVPAAPTSGNKQGNLTTAGPTPK